MTETGRIFYQNITWNGQPALDFGARYNAQSLPPGANVCVEFAEDGTWVGNLPYTVENFQILIEGAPADYNNLLVLHSKVRAAVMHKVWL